MTRRQEDVKAEVLRLDHSALGGLQAPETAPVKPATGRPLAAQQAPEPLRPVDPKAHEPLKPGSKVE